MPVEGALAEAVAALAADVLAGAGPNPVADAAGREWRAGRAALARAVAAAALGADDAPPPDELKDAAGRRMEEVQARAGACGRYLPRRLAEVPKGELWRVSEALHEQGLEHHDTALVLGHKGSALFVVAAPLTLAQAHTSLLKPLYERVEAWVDGYDLPSMEREACRWWLGRWRGPRPLSGDEFASTVREQEFSLAGRVYVAMETSPLEYMVATGALEDAGPKQRHMAERLLASVPGVWSVEGREGDDAVFVHPLTGERCRVREHAPEHRYGAGAVGLGRLIPFGDGSWLRSPGMAVIPGHSTVPGMARHFAEGMEALEGMYPEVTVEAVLSTMAGVRGLPRSVRPPVSPDEAAELGRDLHECLQEIGAAVEVDPAELPPSLRALPGTTALSMEVDVVLGEYMAALIELSKKSRLMRETLRRRARDAKEAKGAKTAKKRSRKRKRGW